MAGGVAGLYLAALGFVGSGMFGGVMGVVQWLFLRRYLKEAAFWIPASFIGWFTGSLVGAFVFGAGIAFQVVAWLGFGLAQALFLVAVVRLRSLPLVALWVIVSTLGGALAAAAVSSSTEALYGLLGKPLGEVSITGLQWSVCAGLVYGGLTAPVLILLIRGARPGRLANTGGRLPRNEA